MSSKNSFLFLNWKDINHPNAGGAEIVMHEILKRLVIDNHKVTLLTSDYNNQRFDTIDGVEIIRIGSNKYLHSFQALWYYINNLKGFDNIIECVNTVPYFTKFFTKVTSKHFLFYHQLAREVWFYETKFPLSYFGYYLLEPIATKIQTLGQSRVITISDSTKNDLIKWGFKKENISIIREGIINKSIDEYNPNSKSKIFTVLFHSSLRPMKRVEDIIKAFKLLLNTSVKAELLISGGGDITKLKELINQLDINNNVQLLGRTDDKIKLDLMTRSTVLASTSIKEGWGLIVTEANSMATPAITYNVDGLRDSNSTGIITKTNTPDALAEELIKFANLFYNNKTEYNSICSKSLEFSKNYNFENAYSDFINVVI
jgi:glycosyltransferase involved in cell wall biosynthesis